MDLSVKHEENGMMKTISPQFRENTAAASVDKNKAPSAQAQSVLVQHKCRCPSSSSRSAWPFLTPQGHVLPSNGPAFALSMVNTFLELFNYPHSARKLHCAKPSLPWSSLRRFRNEGAAGPHISQQVLTIDTAHHALLAQLALPDKTNKRQGHKSCKGYTDHPGTGGQSHGKML